MFLAAAAVLLLKIARGNGFGIVSSTLLIGMFALDAKTVDFSINGMETGMMMFFLALTLKLLLAQRPNPWLIGVAWAGLMWTRPDSFVYISAIALGFLAFNPTRDSIGSRVELSRLYFKAAGLALIVYLPWVLWAWTYYGSPIPHTVIAKGLGSSINAWKVVRALVLYPVGTLFFPRLFDAAWLPPYALMGDWPHWTAIYSRILMWVCAFYWLAPGANRRGRALSLAVVLSTFYLDQLAPFPFPWYLPSCTILATVVLAEILEQLSISAKLGYLGRRSLTGLAVGVLTISLGLTLSAAYQLRIQQREIETGNRKQIGSWLREHASSERDTVFLESLGYIGYFSQLKMLDFPGLASPEVVDARRRLKSEKTSLLIRELLPDWLVLRPSEVQTIQQSEHAVLEQMYSKVKTFDVSDRVRSYLWLPGRAYLMRDETFIVYRKNGKI